MGNAIYPVSLIVSICSNITNNMHIFSGSCDEKQIIQNKKLGNNYISPLYSTVELGAWSLVGMNERWRKEVNPLVD